MDLKGEATTQSEQKSLRATTHHFGGWFYVGPGTFRVGDRVHVRLAKTSDLRFTESRYGTVFASAARPP